MNIQISLEVGLKKFDVTIAIILVIFVDRFLRVRVTKNKTTL